MVGFYSDKAFLETYPSSHQEILQQSKKPTIYITFQSIWGTHQVIFYLKLKLHTEFIKISQTAYWQAHKYSMTFKLTLKCLGCSWSQIHNMKNCIIQEKQLNFNVCIKYLCGRIVFTIKDLISNNKKYFSIIYWPKKWFIMKTSPVILYCVGRFENCEI